MACKRCIEKGKPENYGSDPECAFESERFDKDNWNCATLNELREDIEILNEKQPYPYYGAVSILYSNDNTLCTLPLEEGFLIIGWYKQRGKVDNLFIINGDESPLIPDLKTTELVIERLESRV